MFTLKNIKFHPIKYSKVNSKWVYEQNCRCKNSVEAKKSTYSHTILTPKTKFPARSNNAAKDEITKSAQFLELYEWQRQNNKGPEYILHDGPPYANGDMHMGHAVNKIIKDICNRRQVLKGHKVHYIPGWDCHGLPIELKALQKAKKSSNKMEPNDPVNTRQIARKFALETVERQKDAFKKWGIMGSWDKDIYLTLNKSYIENQLKKFYEMYKKGLIYRALKPVYWSPSSKTALAESELEYDNHYKSKEVYVRFLMDNVTEKMRQVTKNKNIYALIWTTTPWTLIANRGICYNSQLRYGVVQFEGDEGKDLYIVGLDLLEGLQRILTKNIIILAEFEGKELTGCTYKNKLTNLTSPLLDSDHVTAGKGTGLVHMAPAHGPEDFLVALKNNMPIECNVDESGLYTETIPQLNGIYVLKEGQDTIINMLDRDILYQGWYEHAYPLDWRTKKPVIVRASHQWFINTEALKHRALEVLKNVTILPQVNADKYRAGLKSQLEKRPYWCISRQRAWGTPIPALYHDGTAIVDERIIAKIIELMHTKGPDVWWNCDVTELLTDDVIKDLNLDVNNVTKGKDILDIWFDSGISWSSVLQGKTADLYVEGVDQFNGWFQSSLLTGVALKDDTPYKSLFVHGFAVDEHKRKMSKSIGNVIDPLTIVYGGKEKSQPAYGIDTLRWWVASHGTQHSQIVISNTLLQDCQNDVIRIRNILKYLLGVISDVEKHKFTIKPNLNQFDKYTLKHTYQFRQNIINNYNEFKYNHITQLINNFISNIVSGLYCHCIKDRLYCSLKDSNERLASQLVLHTIFVLMLEALGPILPHLVEEAWIYHPLHEKPFFFTKNIEILENFPLDDSIIDKVLNIKKDIHVLAKNEDLKKFNVNIKLNNELFNQINDLNNCEGDNESVLNEILEVSNVELELNENIDNWIVNISKSVFNQCVRCRKYNIDDNTSDVCNRCQIVLNNN